MGSPMSNIGKIVLFAVAGLSAAVIASPSHAQSYPWCAVYGGIVSGGARNCGFTTIDQCRATVSGVGGFCERNPLYEPPARRKRSNQG